MAEKPSITGFFKNFLGLKGNQPEIPANTQPVAPPAPIPAQTTPPVPVKTRTPTQSEAYKSRKKGRKYHRESRQDLNKIEACIKCSGEATPGQLAAELEVARSSLAYNLNRLLAEKRIERLGAGPRIRYRVAQTHSRE